MTTSYWRAPIVVGDQPLYLMDADRGTVYSEKVARLPAEDLTVGGQKMACQHYRLSGTMAADLWFDAQGRLVRQRTVEEGYPTELRLTRLATAKLGNPRR
jgi:hypothetical protein